MEDDNADTVLVGLKELQLKYDAAVIERDTVMVKLENVRDVAERQVVTMEERLLEVTDENQALRLKLCVSYQHGGSHDEYQRRLQEDLDNCQLAADNSPSMSEEHCMPLCEQNVPKIISDDLANDYASLSNEEGFVPEPPPPAEPSSMSSTSNVPVSPSVPVGCFLGMVSSDGGYSSVELSPGASNFPLSTEPKSWDVQHGLDSQDLDSAMTADSQSCSFSNNTLMIPCANKDGMFIRELSRETSDTSRQGSVNEDDTKPAETHFDSLLQKISADVQNVEDDTEKMKIAQDGLRDAYNNLMTESLLQVRHFSEHIAMHKALRFKYKSVRKESVQQVKRLKEYRQKLTQLEEGNQKLIQDIIKMQTLFEDTQVDHNLLKETCTDLENRLLKQYDEYAIKIQELVNINQLLMSAVDSDVLSLEAAHMKLRAEHTVIVEENSELHHQLEDLSMATEKTQNDLKHQLQDSEQEIYHLAHQLTSVKQESDHNLSTLEHSMVDEIRTKEASNVEVLQDRNRLQQHNHDMAKELKSWKQRNAQLKCDLENMTDRLEHVCTTSMQDVDRLEGEKLALAQEYDELADHTRTCEKLKHDTEHLYDQLQQKCEQLINIHEHEKIEMQEDINILNEKIKCKEQECLEIIETCNTIKAQKITIEQDLTELQMCHRNMTSHLKDSEQLCDADIVTMRQELKQLSTMAMVEPYLKDDQCDVNLPSGNIHYSSTPRKGLERSLSDEMSEEKDDSHEAQCSAGQQDDVTTVNKSVLNFELSYLIRECAMYENQIKELKKQLDVQQQQLNCWKSKHLYAITRNNVSDVETITPIPCLDEHGGVQVEITSLDGSNVDYSNASAASLSEQILDPHISLADSDDGISDLDLDGGNISFQHCVMKDTEGLLIRISKLQSEKHKILMRYQRNCHDHQQQLDQRDAKHHLMVFQQEALHMRLLERERALQKLLGDHEKLLDTVEEQCKLRGVVQLNQDLENLWVDGQQYHQSQVKAIQHKLNTREERLRNQQQMLCQRAGEYIIDMSGRQPHQPQPEGTDLGNAVAQSALSQIVPQTYDRAGIPNTMMEDYKDLQEDVIDKHLTALDAMRSKLETSSTMIKEQTTNLKFK